NDHAVIINKVLADSLWPNQNAISRTLNRSGKPRSVVGVVEFDRCTGLLMPSGPCAWEPFVSLGTQAYLRIHTRGDANHFAPELSRIARAIHPDAAISDVSTFDAYVRGLTANQRTSAIISGVLAFVGIALVAIGCFSLFASMVKDKARD